MLLFQIRFHFYFNTFAFLYSEYFHLKQPRQNSLPILDQTVKDPENKIQYFSTRWEFIAV